MTSVLILDLLMLPKISAIFEVFPQLDKKVFNTIIMMMIKTTNTKTLSAVDCNNFAAELVISDK